MNLIKPQQDSKYRLISSNMHKNRPEINRDGNLTSLPGSSKMESPVQEMICTESIFLVDDHFDPVPVFACINGSPEIYSCEECPFKAYLKVNLKVHVEMIHKLGFRVAIDDFCSFADTTYNLTNILKCYTCKNCPFTTFSLLLLLQHEVNCKFNVQTEEVIVIRDSPPPRRQKRAPRPLEKMIYNNRWYECEQCDVKKKYKHEMAKHIEMKHTSPEEAQWFECDQCSFKTRHKGNLRGHRVQHLSTDDVKWFNCEFCSHRAKQINHLRLHVLAKHTPDENIQWSQCDKCPYRAKHNTSLMAHFRTVHTPPDEIKWIQCEICPYKCKRKSQLKKHYERRSHKYDWIT